MDKVIITIVVPVVMLGIGVISVILACYGKYVACAARRKTEAGIIDKEAGENLVKKGNEAWRDFLRVGIPSLVVGVAWLAFQHAK